MVEQNLTCPKDDFWSYLSRPCQIVVVWDDRTTANMDPCTYAGNNASILEGSYPDKLKLSKVVPIFKSGDDSDPNN